MLLSLSITYVLIKRTEFRLDFFKKKKLKDTENMENE